MSDCTEDKKAIIFKNYGSGTDDTRNVCDDDGCTIIGDDTSDLPSEQDPIFKASPAFGITNQDLSNWNNVWDAVKAFWLKFTDNNPMPEDVGGWEQGTTFDKVNYDDMFRGLLYPYQYPSFSDFYILGINDVLEVGDKISGEQSFKWNTNNSENIKSLSISIDDVTGGNTLLSGLDNDGNESYDFGNGITNSTQASNTFRIKAENTKDQEISKDKTYYWKWRLYYGESSNETLTESDIKSLRASMLTDTFARTYALNSGGYKYIVYPDSFGAATGFKDVDTGFAVAMEDPYIVSVTNAFGQTTDYKVYRTTNIINSSINIKVS